MNYGIFGVMMPLLMEKPTMEYLEDAGISVSAREIKREFKEIIKRQPDIGGYRNKVLMGLYLAAYLAAVYNVAYIPVPRQFAFVLGFHYTLYFTDGYDGQNSIRRSALGTAAVDIAAYRNVPLPYLYFGQDLQDRNIDVRQEGILEGSVEMVEI